MSEALTAALRARSSTCELCGAASDLDAWPVPPAESTVDRAVLACSVCRTQLTGDLDPQHWFCLQGAIWSEVPAVQVVSWRLLRRLSGETWAVDLLDQAYLDDETLAWARDDGTAQARVATVDSNGTPLCDGDSVTLIKDLPVKGANFTAKRGTLVKSIRLTSDPGLVEGRVNKIGIVLKTEFLKRS